jgi:hypothetical protein
VRTSTNVDEVCAGLSPASLPSSSALITYKSMGKHSERERENESHSLSLPLARSSPLPQYRWPLECIDGVFFFKGVCVCVCVHSIGTGGCGSAGQWSLLKTLSSLHLYHIYYPCTTTTTTAKVYVHSFFFFVLLPLFVNILLCFLDEYETKSIGNI